MNSTEQAIEAIHLISVMETRLTASYEEVLRMLEVEPSRFPNRSNVILTFDTLNAAFLRLRNLYRYFTFIHPAEDCGVIFSSMDVDVRVLAEFEDANTTFLVSSIVKAMADFRCAHLEVVALLESCDFSLNRLWGSGETYLFFEAQKKFINIVELTIKSRYNQILQ